MQRRLLQLKMQLTCIYNRKEWDPEQSFHSKHLLATLPPTLPVVNLIRIPEPPIFPHHTRLKIFISATLHINLSLAINGSNKERYFRNFKQWFSCGKRGMKTRNLIFHG